jgi:RsiW-degrading membrane proteinase PrsW (M82 family)
MFAIHHPPHPVDRRPPGSTGWRGTLFTGLALWIASVLVTGLTGNLNMIPTVVLLGSFLVPATAVIWYLDHYVSDIVTPGLAFRAFIVGGVIGVLAASIFESLLPDGGPFLFFAVGLAEELAKLIGLLLIARHLRRYTVRDGIVLGAAVGFGFAALESSGYALTSLFVQQGHTITLSLGSLVSTEVFRGILAPLGHGLWTAILGGALFAASRDGRLRLSFGIVGAYLLVALLHGLWDSMGIIASLLTAVYLSIPSAGVDWLREHMTRPEATMLLDMGLYFVGLVILSLIGFAVLRRRWRSGQAPIADEPAVLQAA